MQLQKDVMDELVWDPILSSTEIGVTVKNGIVTLSGQVTSFGKKVAAENAAKRVKEVKAVATDIVVKLPGDLTLSDTDIAGAALNALKWSSFVPDNKVKLKVDDGWVTLEGEVEWQFERESASSAIRNLIGVKGIHNLITVKPRITSRIVKDAIKKALERSADIEAENIQIIADGGKVTMKGKVHSWNERSAVERAVWSTPGITDVKDELVIAL